MNEMNKNLDRKLNQIINKKLGDSVGDMTNNNNSKIVEVVVLENKMLNSDDNSESIVGVENSEKSDKFDENKDNQVTYNEVNRGENYDDIIKHVVLESKVVNIDSACLLYTSRCV